LLQRHEDFATFDRIFDLFWSGVADSSGDRRGPDRQFAARAGGGSLSDSTAAGLDEIVEVGVRAWTSVETIASRDFASLTDDELAVARSAIASMHFDAGDRRTRRWISGRGARIDMRRAIARSLKTGGEILALPRRRRRVRTRPVVLLCDVSGSMELYSRTLLHFAHSLARQRRRVEAFLFATRLTRITMELRSPKPDAAIAAVSHTVRDWSGGTRTGEALRAFHQRWRRRALHSDAVVILISDGWDRGDPMLLRTEIARMQRSCHRLIWLNPLIGSVDYAPLTQGLQAALPFVDDFLPVRTLRDVRDLALHLGSIDHRGRPAGGRSKLHGHHRLVHFHGAARTRVGADARSRGDRVMHSGL
jgi:uncharacterized protein with von Willebrand factor type A (vWA) domain